MNEERRFLAETKNFDQPPLCTDRICQTSKVEASCEYLGNVSRSVYQHFNSVLEKRAGDKAVWCIWLTYIIQENSVYIVVPCDDNLLVL